MSEFRNFTVVKEANVFFDGKVASRTVCLPTFRRRLWASLQPSV
jgi:hypothetical protein